VKLKGTLQIKKKTIKKKRKNIYQREKYKNTEN
jgi:hypothetical protein